MTKLKQNKQLRISTTTKNKKEGSNPEHTNDTHKEIHTERTTDRHTYTTNYNAKNKTTHT